MKKGKGAALNFNAHSDIIIRISGALLPVLLFLYGFALQHNIVHGDRTLTPGILYGICVPWLILGMYQLIRPAKSRTSAILRLAAYHALGVLYLWFISGFNMPFIACWVILFLASHTYLGRDGLNFSILVFFAAGLGDAILNMDNPHYVMQALLVFIGTLVVGYVTGTITANTEVDQQELMRSHAEELRQRDRILTIVNNMADAVFSVNKEGIIQMYNAACLNLLDTNSELLGRSIDSVIAMYDGDSKRFRLARKLFSAKSVQTREDMSTVISGETIRLSVIYSPIRSTNSNTSAESDGYIVIMRDITKQKSLEEERDEFISVVSHELRTPITVAEGSLSNLQLMMGRDDIPASRRTETVLLAHNQVLFLAKLVNDLSTLSRAERGVADEAESIDVQQLVHDLYNEYAPQAEAKGLRFNLDTSTSLGYVTASRLYLKELLQNFITNAIKYTKEGDVTLKAQRNESEILFAVKDTGIGISKSDQVHIFEKFWRSEDYRTRETGGTGLGLYVTRKLAKKLGVEIEMTSRLNHGSTFGFTIQTTDDTKQP